MFCYDFLNRYYLTRHTIPPPLTVLLEGAIALQTKRMSGNLLVTKFALISTLKDW